MKTSDSEWKDYPIKTAEITELGRMVHYRGHFEEPALREKCVAVIGSRRMTRYGRQVTEKIVADLVLAQVTVISGFMYGIDTVAHETVVAEKGRTIAVFGSGINQIYPPDHEKLYTNILRENGAVLSEFSPEQKPKPWMYAKRNQIVAALANYGVIVIEASKKSGSLITAEYALKLQRPLFAVPGPINSSVSEGTNQLIKDKKARLITNINDIDGIKKLKKEIKNSPTHLSPVESQILTLLKQENIPLSLDEIAILTKNPIGPVSTEISLMQLKGLVEEVTGKYIAN